VLTILLRRLLYSSLIAASATAQPAPLTVDKAVEQALQRYPAIRSSTEQVSAAAAAISLARTAYLPRADFLGQLNRATHNNVFGLLMPQTVIPSISGPVLGTNSLGSVWGSAAGVLVSWEPFDFGLRAANVRAAAATKDRTAAEVGVTRLEVATAAADSFLTMVAAQQTAVAARAGVERAQVVNKVIETLVKNELRPGADEARTRAELAVARTQQIQAEQAVEVARAALVQFVGTAAPDDIVIEPGLLLKPPPNTELTQGGASQHPLALARAAVTAEVKEREKVLERSYYPRFYLQGASYGRGTGIQADGRVGGAISGIGPNIQNWALGGSIMFQPFDWFSIRAKREIELHNERTASARYDQTIQDVTAGIAKASAVLSAARRIAENTPIQLEAARATEQMATARYKAGLGNITEVAEAQRLLTQAEIDHSLAQLGVWRALLGVAAAQGELTPFLTMAGK
jgi:outer membrane protein